MVGLLALGNGVVLAIGAKNKRVSPETTALAVLSAAAFTVIDVVYVAKKRIRGIYLADAVVEAVLALTVVCSE